MRIVYSILLMFFVSGSGAQPLVYFGTTKDERGTHQARFEAERDESFRKITYAPYGITPVTFQDLIDSKTHITFSWPKTSCTYQCNLKNLSTTGFVAYEGICSCKGDTIRILLRDFTGDDAEFQGNNLLPSMDDIKIIERAEKLMNNGKNWNRHDNRVCDNRGDVNQWSLFCALHQASIDVVSEYRHIRPAMKAIRNAIQNINPAKKYAHLLQDFNNEAKDYEDVSSVLKQAKETLMMDISSGKK
jgi:hypothetical protein